MREFQASTKKNFGFIANSFILGAFILFGSVFLHSNMVFFSDVAANYDKLIIEGPYDWTDTAVFTDLIRSGYWFKPHPQFIAGESLWGLIPPMFMLTVIPIDAVIGNLNVTFILLSVLMQLPVLYYAIRDWKHPMQKLFILLILGWSAITWHQFPLMMRLREQMAVLFLVLMFKNVFRLHPIINHIVFSVFMILSQPLVAIVGAVAYPIMEAEGRVEKFDKRYIICFALLALVFLGVYWQHFELKGSGFAPPNTIGFAQLVIAIAELDYLPLLILQLLPISIFFLLFCKPAMRKLWMAYVAWLMIVVTSTYFPAVFMQIVGPFSEDFNLMFYAMFVLGAMEPGSEKPVAKKEDVVVLLVLLYLIAYAFASPSLWSAQHDEAFSQTPLGSKVLAVAVHFWDGPRWILFKSFDFKLIGEMYLHRLPIITYYSPMQQFYDTEKLWPDTQKLIMAVDANDWQACSSARKALANKTDYLSLLAVEVSGTPSSWSYGLWSRLNNRTLMQKCGLWTEPTKSPDPYYNEMMIYRLKAEAARE